MPRSRIYFEHDSHDGLLLLTSPGLHEVRQTENGDQWYGGLEAACQQR